jgi:hypothetical protein
MLKMLSAGELAALPHPTAFDSDGPKPEVEEGALRCDTALRSRK